MKGPSDSEAEHHLLSFAHSEGVRYLTLYRKSTSYFFSHYAPQMAFANPAAKHALIGLSAQYQAVLNRTKSEGCANEVSRCRTDALLHYNRAMKTLAKPNETQAPLEVLVACSILFAAIELWPQKNMAPHVHILHGTRICQSVPASTVNSNTLMGYLLRLLSSLAENVASYHDDFTEESFNITDTYMELAWPIPIVFQESAYANEEVDMLLKRVARLDNMSAGDHASRRKKLWQIHGQLSSAIYDSRKQVSRGTAIYHDFRLLQLHLQVARIALRTNMSNDEMAFDDFREDFEHMLTEIEELLAYELLPGSERGPSSMRSNLGLLPPMFILATKCRDLTLRRRALELLHGSRRRERSWNSCVASMLAQTVIAAEAESSAGGLPSAEHRICLSHVEFDREKGQVTIQYRRQPWDGTGIEETVVRPWVPNIDDNFELVSLSDKSLRAYGYTGTILISPRIACQCAEEPRL